MGQIFSILKNIIIIIKESCDVLGKMDPKLAAPGLGILSKIRLIFAFIPWYIYGAIAVGGSLYFLPRMMKMLADWINSLKSASSDLKKACRNGSEAETSNTDSAAKVTQLEKVIEDLQAGFERMEKMLKDYQDYAVKHNILPMEASNVRFLISS